METKKHINRAGLSAFFRVKPRGLSRVLRDAGIQTRTNSFHWHVVLEALGLDPCQSDEHWSQLTKPLLTAQEVASLLGKDDPSIVYRWGKKDSGRYKPDFPVPIDLSFGTRPNARNTKRWRKAEILAWFYGKPLPDYRRLPEKAHSSSQGSPELPSIADKPATHPGLFALPDFKKGEQA